MAVLEGYDVIAFAFADWHASWTLPQQVATRLAPQNRVLYVDVPRPFVYFLRKPDTQGAGAWEGPRVQEIRPNFHVYHPPHVFLPIGHLPYTAGQWALTRNGRLLARLVKKAAAQLGFGKPILWNFSILHGMAVENMERLVNLYDTGDEWTSYMKNTTGRRLVEWIEERLCRQADVVFVGTENMKTRRAGWNPETYVVHHAADYAHFSKAALPETPIPDDVARLPRPIIGTVGVMDAARFDMDLIVHLATQRPQWSVVLVGPARADMDLRPLQGIPNVHVLGNRAIADLPSYLKAFDAAVVPYKVNEATRNIYPLKLHEYLATGKPVVSAALPALRPYGDVVAIAESYSDFVAKIERSIQEDTAAKREARQAVARRNSWEQRVEEKSRHILRLIEARSGAKRA
jgi:glycosyltransferase involved in cell wall biosynthesis